MIVDRLERAALYMNLSKGVELALRTLQQGELVTRPIGRYDLDGDRVYAMIQEYNTRTWEESKLESHRRYLDVQYMISGDEKMGYAPKDSLAESMAYDAARDVAFHPGIGEPITVRQGMFAIFFPYDAHTPGLGVASGGGLHVRKVVFKVLVG